MAPSAHDREAEFWDVRVPDLADCIREVEAGPDANTAIALELLEPLRNTTVLDVGCGTGILSAWLAAKGANVVGVDVSEASLERARELHAQLGHNSVFINSDLAGHAHVGETYDRLAGRYVLHHLDPPSVASHLSALVKPGGSAAFVETVGLNPVLRIARRTVIGRFGIPRYGSLDERPLTRNDLQALEQAFGELSLTVGEVRFLRIFDRQVLRYRSRVASRLCGAADDVLRRVGLRMLSYHQVVFLRKDLNCG